MGSKRFGKSSETRGSWRNWTCHWFVVALRVLRPAVSGSCSVDIVEVRILALCSRELVSVRVRVGAAKVGVKGRKGKNTDRENFGHQH